MLSWVCSCETIQHSYPVALPSSLQRTLSYVSAHDRGCCWPSHLDSRHFYEGETLHTPQTAGLENLRGLPSGPCGYRQRVGGERVTVLSVRQSASSEASKSHTLWSPFPPGGSLSKSITREEFEKLVLWKGLLCPDTLIMRQKSLVAHVSNPSTWEEEIDTVRVLPSSKGHTPNS